MTSNAQCQWLLRLLHRHADSHVSSSGPVLSDPALGRAVLRSGRWPRLPLRPHPLRLTALPRGRRTPLQGPHTSLVSLPTHLPLLSPSHLACTPLVRHISACKGQGPHIFPPFSLLTHPPTLLLSLPHTLSPSLGSSSDLVRHLPVCLSLPSEQAPGGGAHRAAARPLRPVP